MDSFPLVNRRKLEYLSKLSHRADNKHLKNEYKSRDRCNKKENSQYDIKFVNKRKGISKSKHELTHYGWASGGSGMEYYRNDSESFTPMDNLDLEIDENVLRVCKIYLKRSLFNDCKLVRLNTNYVEHIVDLIFNLGFFSKRGHFRRDILDLIHLIEVPEPMLHLLGMNRNHRLSIFKGVSLKANLSHPDMPKQLNRCKVLLIKHFSSMEDESHMGSYDTIASMIDSMRSFNSLVEKIVSHGVQLVISENYVSYDVAGLLAKKNICCLSKVGQRTMSKLAFALNCNILYSLDSEPKLNKYIGVCEKFRLFHSGFSIATLTLPEWFKGFTIMISSRMIRSENLNRIKELIKISIVRLQGIVEELELIDNLNGMFIVDTSVFDSDFEDNNDICENFSDYLDMVLGNTSRSSVSSSSPRSNLNYFSCDIYYNKIVESEISCNEYRKLTRLQCFQYYTRINELCVKPTFETIPIGNYLEGLFFSDFISRITNSLKINKCVVNPNCSESFINHQLHFETAYSNIENMRLSLTFQMSSEKYDQDGINVKTFCTVCNRSQIHKVQDLTFGRFLQLMLFNRSYRSKCDHLLFYNNKFSVLTGNYSITFNLSPVSIYTVVPEFNEPLYNCSMDTVPFRLNCNTIFDKRLQNLSNKVVNMVHNLDYKLTGVKVNSNRVFRNLYFGCQNTLTQSLSYFYNKVFENVSSNFQNLVNYDIECHLPCLCQLSRAYAPSYLDRSQWLCSIKDLTFDEFMYKYQKHSAFGIEINYRLNEKLKNYFESGCGLHVCESCGLDAYTTLADIDLLNWFYILVHVVKAFESKVVKLKAGLSQVLQHSKDVERFYRSVTSTEENLLGVFMQCVSLLIYSRYFCPRDPLYLFVILKSFFVSFFNLFEELLYDYLEISHIDQISSFKILEYDRNNIIIRHTFCNDGPKYQKIDYVKKTSEYVKPFVEGKGDEEPKSSKVKEKEKERRKENKKQKQNSFDEDLYTVYTVDEFLSLSQYFAILSGIQDLAKTNVSAQKSSYFKLISKIKARNVGKQSIVCPKYMPIIQPTRDVSNIISNVLVSKRYLESFRSQTKCIRIKEYTRKYIDHLKESQNDCEYELYRYEGYNGSYENNRTEKNKVGLCYNYIEISRMKRNFSKYLFGKMENKCSRNTNDTNSIKCSSDSNDNDTKSRNNNRCSKRSRYIPQCQIDSPFYGLPVVFTNSKLLNYSCMDFLEEELKDNKLLLSGMINKHIYLSGKLVEKCYMLNVDWKLVVKKVDRECRLSMLDVFYRKNDSNGLCSLVGLFDLDEYGIRECVDRLIMYRNSYLMDFVNQNNYRSDNVSSNCCSTNNNSNEKSNTNNHMNKSGKSNKNKNSRSSSSSEYGSYGNLDNNYDGKLIDGWKYLYSIGDYSMRYRSIGNDRNNINKHRSSGNLVNSSSSNTSNGNFNVDSNVSLNRKPYGKHSDSVDSNNSNSSDSTNYGTNVNSSGFGSSGNLSSSVDLGSNEFEVYFGPYCITVYYASEFHALRHKFCGDDMNFVRSLSRCTRMPSIGKSGSPIFMTYDGKFTLKIINKHEMALFVSQGGEFFKYFEKNDTLMSLPYGLFKVSHPKTNTSVNLFVMQNIDYFHHSWKVSFDLKGISLRRYVSLSQDYVISFNSNPVVTYINGLTFNHGYSLFRKESINDGSNNLKNGSCVLLDQNFKLYTKGCPIQLDYDSISTVNKRLKSDLEFLSSINIVDYSLLLRILPSESVITLGLIDFLRPYTWDKQIETVGKRLANIGQAPTIVSPNEYKTRFSSFMQKIFIYPYHSKTNKESYEIISSQESQALSQSEGIDFNYHIKSYTSCNLCRILKYMYSNSYFTCLKFYMTLMSPEVMQYLHLLVSRYYPELLEELKKSGLSQEILTGSWKMSSMEYSRGSHRSYNQGMDELVKLLEHLYQSPTMNWNYV